VIVAANAATLTAFAFGERSRMPTRTRFTGSIGATSDFVFRGCR
jgi:hypothetical protein